MVEAFYYVYFGTLKIVVYLPDIHLVTNYCQSFLYISQYSKKISLNKIASCDALGYCGVA